MFYVLLFMLIFVIVYFGFYFFYDDALRKEKVNNIKILLVLINKFNLNKKEMDNRLVLKWVAIINSFIIAICTVIVDMLGIDKWYSFFVVAIIIVVLILVCYYIFGKVLHKKWGNKDGV